MIMSTGTSTINQIKQQYTTRNTATHHSNYNHTGRNRGTSYTCTDTFSCSCSYACELLLLSLLPSLLLISLTLIITIAVIPTAASATATAAASPYKYHYNTYHKFTSRNKVSSLCFIQSQLQSHQLHSHNNQYQNKIGMLMMMKTSKHDHHAFIPQAQKIDSIAEHHQEHHQQQYYTHQKYFSEYEQAMNHVFSSFRILQKKDKLHDFHVAKDFLLSPLKYVSDEDTDDGTDGTDTDRKNHSNNHDHNEKHVFHQKLQRQRHSFIESTCTSRTTSTTDTTVITSKQIEIIQRSLTYIGDYCAKQCATQQLQQQSNNIHNNKNENNNDNPTAASFLPLLVAWEKIVECGLKPRINCLSTYLYILSSSSSSNNNNNNNHDNHHIHDVINQVAYYHDMLYSPTENTIAIQIKSFISTSQPLEAEQLLWNHYNNNKDNNNDNNKNKKKNSDNNMKLKLRTCFPILQYYCQSHDDNNKNISSALTLYHKMKQISSIHFDKETYTILISAIARHGYFCPVSSSNILPIVGAEELGYNPGYGPLLFDTLAQEMALDILEICDDCANQIRNAFILGFQKHLHGSDNNNMIRHLQPVPYDCHLSPVLAPAQDDELVVNRVTIDEGTCICPRTNVKLRLILLDDDQRKHMHDTLLTMADLQFEAYETKLEAKGQKSQKKRQHSSNKGNDNDDGDNNEKKDEKEVVKFSAGKHLDSFATWLDTREGNPFTAIVDGANVAYFGHGSVNYHQVHSMVKELEKMGETPLVVMPQKYTQRKFYLRQGYVQELTQAQLDILDELTTSGKLYEVPSRCLDDYYWMLSSVSNQTISRNHSNIDVDPNVVGRWPGTRPILITNDQMRDHKLALLEPRLFQRWFSSHIVNYEFEPCIKDIWEEREIKFVKADCFSREIQGNYKYDEGGSVRGSGIGADEKSKASAVAWHFPVQGWSHNDRLCIRIPILNCTE